MQKLIQVQESNNDGWQYYNDADFPTTLASGQGYLTRLKSTGTDGKIAFTGPLNNSPLNVTVANTLTDNGWNALGNPFTSALDIKSTVNGFLNLASNLDVLETGYKAIYLWYQTDGSTTGTGSYTAGVEQYYSVINNAGYSLVRTYNGILTDNFIQAGQGFLINAGIDGGVLTFTKAMQAHSTALTMKTSETSWPGLTLLAINKGRTRSAVVAFNENMTTGLDETYDAGLLSTSGFNLYTTHWLCLLVLIFRKRANLPLKLVGLSFPKDFIPYSKTGFYRLAHRLKLKPTA